MVKCLMCGSPSEAPHNAGCPLQGTKNTDVIRKYSTGATRDTAEGKFNYAGFQSALVSKRFATYMDKNRIQSDGSLRDADNWKKGIPQEDYFQSLGRHIKDLELVKEGFPKEAREQDVEDILCAILFNAQGMLFEVLRAKYDKPKTVTDPTDAMRDALMAVGRAQDAADRFAQTGGISSTSQAVAGANTSNPRQA